MVDASNYNIHVSSLKADSLTNERVVFVDSTGKLVDNANLFFNNNTLSSDSVSLGTNENGKLKVKDVSGTNISGKDLTIASGRGTGTGVGGDILFKSSASLSSGSAVNPLDTNMIITDSGNVGIGTVNPTSKVYVSGDVSLTGGVKFHDINAYSWSQIGTDISGEVNGDCFGHSIDINQDGSLLVIGAYKNDGTGTEAGQARVYEYNTGSNSWTQKGTDIDGKAAGDQSGLNVSISKDGNFVSSGAQYNESGGVNAGHVKIYKWKSDDWGGTDYEWEIIGQPDANFGVTNILNQDGSRILVGGPSYTSNTGVVEVYRLVSNAWTKMGSSLSGSAAGDYFGKWAQISGSGNIIAVGSPGADGAGTDRGNVKIYEWNSGSSVWAQKGSTILGASDSDAIGDRFGLSISNSGLILAIASNTSSSNTGYVKVYQWNSGSSDWAQLGNTFTGDAGSRFGSSVSLNKDGTVLAIGAFSNDDNGIDTGQTKVYLWNGVSWAQRGSDIDGTTDYDYSGHDVRVNADGTRLIIASPQTVGNNNGNKTGIVKGFSLGLTSNTTTVKGNPSLSGDITFTLPNGYGSSGQVLSTDESGNLSWIDNGSGSGGSGATTINALTDAKSGGTNFSNSIILGHQSVGDLSEANNNTAVGYATIPGITSGDDNTAIGYNAGNSITTGTGNTLLGSGTATSAVDASNQTAVGYNAACEQNNEISLGNSSITTLRCATSAIASLSDRRDKKDIQTCPFGLNFIEKLKPVQFTWDRRVLDRSDKYNPNNGTTRLGFIAQDFQEAMPNGENSILDLVNEYNPDRIEAKYSNLIPILTKAIQELQEKVKSLEDQLNIQKI